MYTTVTCICVQCGLEFAAKKAPVLRKFCTEACRLKARKERQARLENMQKGDWSLAECPFERGSLSADVNYCPVM